MIPESLRCYLVKKSGKDQIEASVERRPLFELPAGELLVQVAYSSMNYKDALAVQGHPGVVRHFPHVPGIDAAGTVVDSKSPDFRPGDRVVVTGYQLGVERWGGWAEFVRVPAQWAVPLPVNLSLEESMILGTAGLTAGLCVRALQQHEVVPGTGDVVVTGASGGVGSVAVMLLAQLGYPVVAVSGKKDRHAWLKELGALRIVSREDIVTDSERPLLAAKYAGAVDTAGGKMLASLLRRIEPRGCVACCGLVGGADLNTTVYPFILRGITLTGIDSAECPYPLRSQIWQRFSGAWKLDHLAKLARHVTLGQITESVAQMLRGKLAGRTVVDLEA